MPRTRAALRSNTILEDEVNIAPTIALPLTPLKDREPLCEITNNTQEDSTGEKDHNIDRKASKKAVAKIKKTKGGMRSKKNKAEHVELNAEVLEDEIQSETSSAVDDACDELMKEINSEMHQARVHDVRPKTPPSRAVQAVGKLLTPKTQAPRFDPELDKLEKDNTMDREQREDSFEAMIESRTPMKFTQSENSVVDADKDTKAEQLEEDDFVKHIVTRSPVRPMTRIEDSVEAIDALEDAIEKVGESIPLLVDPPESPIKVSKGRKGPAKTAASGSQATKKIAPTKTNKEPATNRMSSSQHKTPSRRSPTKPTPSARAAVKAPSQPKEAQTKATHSSSPTSTKVPATSRVLRVASITKAPFVPAKSAKPPTRSTFSLPGEAISQKLKQQREERLKREEEESTKKRVFKARPTPTTLSQKPPVVRSTAASKARLSISQGVGKTDGTPNVTGPVIRPTGRVSSARSTKAIVDGPTSTSTTITKPIQKHPSSILTTANSNKRISTASTINGPPKAPYIPSSSRMSMSVTPKEAAQQKIRGKEVFNRGKEEREERERERKEKEEAAKKARKEAAERGRVASREWAERMRGRKEAKVVVVK